MLSWWAYPILFATGLFAGLVDSVAGGGGIISLPVLLNFGLPVSWALGTNKLQASFGSGTATWHYVRGGLVQWRNARIAVVSTLIGAVLGAWAVRALSNHFLEQMIPWLLAAIIVYTVVRPKVGGEDRPAKWPVGLYGLVFGLGLGFYDGFFGPGVGSFWTMAYVVILGYNFQKATGYTKVMNFTSNVTALIWFAATGSVGWGVGLTMAAGQIVGARIGARLVLTRGARFVRPLFLAMAIATAARLLYLTLRR